MADADRLLEVARQAQGELGEDSEERHQIVAAAELLGKLLLQDVERTEGGVSLKDGVSRDRMMPVHDPEMRHGHKSSRRRFDGHKAAIVVDTDSQLITAVEVLPGNAPNNLEAGACTCPAGNVTRRIRPSGTRTAPNGRTHRLKGFRFDGAVCRVCPLRSQCVAGSSRLG